MASPHRESCLESAEGKIEGAPSRQRLGPVKKTRAVREKTATGRQKPTAKVDPAVGLPRPSIGSSHTGRSVAGRLAQIHLVGRGEPARRGTYGTARGRTDGRAAGQRADDRAARGADGGAGQGTAARTLPATSQSEAQEGRCHNPQR